MDKVVVLEKVVLQKKKKHFSWGFFSILGDSSKEGTRGSSGPAVGAGEDRGREEKVGGKTKEV